MSGAEGVYLCLQEAAWIVGERRRLERRLVTDARYPSGDFDNVVRCPAGDTMAVTATPFKVITLGSFRKGRVLLQRDFERRGRERTLS